MDGGQLVTNAHTPTASTPTSIGNQNQRRIVLLACSESVVVVSGVIMESC
jgi:hypothetical protein